MKKKLTFLIASLGVCVAIWSAIFLPSDFKLENYEPRWLISALATDGGTSLSVAELLLALPQPVELDVATKTEDCHVSGVYPDHACTPGSVFDVDLEVMCTPGYTKEVRNVSTTLKKKIYAAYGIAYPQPTGTYELDHLIPLALGGDNSEENLFPEAEGPKPGFKEKDVVEVYLHEEVCAGHLGLKAAQVQIANDWLAVYTAISPSEASRIRQKYGNWSN